MPEKTTSNLPPSTSQNESSTEKSARDILSGKSKKSGILRLLPFLGPAFIASVAYMDPGNFATNIQGGAKFGYTLIWVILVSNLMAMLIQSLSAKLGIATGMNLAQHMHKHFSHNATIAMWILMELVAMATDLAEFLGAAVGFNLLFGIPLWLAGLITAAVTFLILGLERFGFRPLEAAITSLVGVISICYLIETILDRPNWPLVLTNIVHPTFSGSNSILVAAGILGATVMPHAIFLHSALTQDRIKVTEPTQLKRLYHYEIVDVLIAMGMASLVNGAMLIMAASTFFKSGYTSVGTLEEAYKTLVPLLGSGASLFFSISLLASGLSSSSVGTMAGQIIMQGFLNKEIPVWIRRMVIMIPSLVVIFLGFDPTQTLVMSQVVLSFGIPFAVIPLVYFTSQKNIMGELANRRVTTLLGIITSAIILVLNFYLLFQTFFGG